MPDCGSRNFVATLQATRATYQLALLGDVHGWGTAWWGRRLLEVVKLSGPDCRDRETSSQTGADSTLSCGKLPAGVRFRHPQIRLERWHSPVAGRRAQHFLWRGVGHHLSELRLRMLFCGALIAIAAWMMTHG